YEGLDQLDRDLLELEHARADKELLARIFRCVHTIKGTCGFLGFSKLESVTHIGESLLAKLRDGGVAAPTSELTTTLLKLVDAIRQMLSAVESTGTEGEGDFSALIEELNRMYEGREAVRKEVAPVVQFIALTPSDDDESEIVQPDLLCQVELNSPADANKASVAETNIRVDVALLDRLMTLVGELVLARNQILQHGNAAPQGSALATASQRLNLLTTELQEGVMKTRMQPIGNIWRKLPRVVRDLAVACSKEIRLDLEGSDTELDKTIIEAIKDPLTHIVRNAADHGIETPGERTAKGKPAEGRLSLRAFHEGGKVIVEITDDGRGLDAQKLKRKAVEKGIVLPEHAARMSDREAWNLIFLPGFSTAQKLSNISGRGVGMDVVKTNIEKIGGVVDVQSVIGGGTTLKIKIPLTLAIIPGLIITTAGDRFAIPQVNLLELLRLEGAEAQSRIEMLYGAPVYRLRGNLLPLVHLNYALGFTPDRWLKKPIDVINIVVVQADGTPFGLVVDTINDTEEIVVKPLGRQLKGIPA
ncbi:MAG: chemotaxis protein CheA, partial [Gemmatimonadaceae bacterium]